MSATKRKTPFRKPSKCLFVVLFEGRTGSSYVVSCLNSHPNVLCYPEILNNCSPADQRKVLDSTIRGFPVEKINPHPRYESYYHGSIHDKIDLQSVGFKTKLYQVQDLQWFFPKLQENGFKLIYLKRRNIIKSVLSIFNARRLQRKYRVWNAEQENQIQGAIYIEPELFLKELDKRIEVEIAHEKFFEAYELEKKIFYYEDLIADPKTFFLHLLECLYVSSRDLKGKFFKSTPDRLSEAIQNYQEIRGLFSGTRFERFFEE